MKSLSILLCAESAFTLPRAGQRPLIATYCVHRRGLKTTTAARSHPDLLAPATGTSHTSPESSHHDDPSIATATAVTAPLSILPLSQVLRTWFITSISSSPLLLGTSTRILRAILESRNPLWQLDRNPILRSVLWHTFYRQFCTGSTEAEVARGCQELRQQGYSGVIVEYALEVLKDAEGSDEATDIAIWRKGMLDTVDMASPGDFLGLKWSGMGPAAMRLMAQNKPPTAAMAEAMHALCDAAATKGLSLLPSAEESWTLDGFNAWTLGLQREYNRDGRCVLYNTYQAYLKRTPESLARHLEQAAKEGYTLGVKLVRGAYLGSEERGQIWPTIEETHHHYNTIATALLQKRSNECLPAKAWPDHRVMLATHNADTVSQMQELRREQKARGEPMVQLAFAQLMGMADEVSCTLIAAARTAETDPTAVSERVFKCTTWGTMHQCLNYLLRRAAENKDAAGRTHSTRDAMRGEVWRRMKATFGVA